MPGPWGAAIKALREQRKSAPGSQPRHWTQAAVAKRAGMTPTSYGKIEKGGHTRTSKLLDIAEVFKVPIEYVLMPMRAHISEDQQRALILEVVSERLRPTPLLPPQEGQAHVITPQMLDAALKFEEAREADANKHKTRRRNGPIKKRQKKSANG